MTLDYDRTVVSVLDEALRQYERSDSFTCLGHTLTYGDLDRLSGQFAAYLQ